MVNGNPHDLGKHRGQNQHGEQWIEESPEEPQHRALVTNPQFLEGERPDQLVIPVDISNQFFHLLETARGPRPGVGLKATFLMLFKGYNPSHKCAMARLLSSPITPLPTLGCACKAF